MKADDDFSSASRRIVRHRTETYIFPLFFYNTYSCKSIIIETIETILTVTLLYMIVVVCLLHLLIIVLITNKLYQFVFPPHWIFAWIFSREECRIADLTKQSDPLVACVTNFHRASGATTRGKN